MSRKNLAVGPESYAIVDEYRKKNKLTMKAAAEILIGKGSQYDGLLRARLEKAEAEFNKQRNKK